MVYQYLREIEDTENDIKNAMQISSILLKHQVYDKKLEELSKIDTIEGNISSNLVKINDNENSISNNLSKIDNISKFLLKSDKDFEKTYNIKSQRFEFDKENNFFNIMEEEIEHDFIKNSLLFIKNNMYYKYDDISDDYHRCQHEYNIYDNENNLIHKYLFNKDTYYEKNSDILNTNEEFCIFLKQNYNKIKIVLELHRHNRHGFGNIDLEIVDNNNYIKIEYIEQGFLDNSHLVNLNKGLIETNTSNISTNLGLINTNEGNILDNLGKINTNTSSISNNTKLIETNKSSISTNSGLISTNTSNILDNKGLIDTNTSNILDNKGLIELYKSKINNIENNLIEIDDVYNETFIIQNFTLSSKTALFFYKTINLNFTTNGIIKINAKYNYLKNYNLNHIYRFYNNKSLFKEIKTNDDKFEIQSIDASAIDIGIHYDNNIDNKLIKLLSNSTLQFNYINNIHKLDINKNNIESNLIKINENIDKINEINEINKNIKSFYNLDQIFIYDIENGYKNVDKDNHFHIFEKEITYNFIKNSYLEIALKVLTEISNYVLIGFFQILCNFYDQDNNLFYTISLSTAAGSINKLSTIESVFIVPINENMSKMKIDFFIAPKESQQNRSANFTIQDINSNKIYLKYYQKTNEMVIKNNLLYYTDIEKKELLRFDNETTTIIRPLYANIHYKYIEYNFKKDDIIEFECKLILNHNLYDVIKNNLTLYFQLENDTDTIHNEVRDYIEFIPDRNSNVTIYIKFLYKFKFDDKISLRIFLDVIQDTRKSYLIVNLNENSYVSLKKLSL